MNPVFVVDDNESYRELVTLALQDHCGLEQVQGFGSAHALRRHLDTPGIAHPALVLLDLHMPDVDGLALLQEIRRRDPDLPVAFLSGAAGTHERDTCLAAGAMAFLRKPVAYGDLIRGLQGLVRSVGGAASGG